MKDQDKAEVISEVRREKAPKEFMAGNVRAQPFDFFIRGRWIRWEPKGTQGAVQKISEAERYDPDFRRLEKAYFNVKEA